MQVREIVDGWMTHRCEAPTLVLDEFERCVTLLTHSPDIGSAFRRTKIAWVRRVVVLRTRYLVYYIHDVDHQVVYIIAVWGAPLGVDPVLRDPR